MYLHQQQPSFHRSFDKVEAHLARSEADAKDDDV